MLGCSCSLRRKLPQIKVDGRVSISTFRRANKSLGQFPNHVFRCSGLPSSSQSCFVSQVPTSARYTSTRLRLDYLSTYLPPTANHRSNMYSYVDIRVRNVANCLPSTYPRLYDYLCFVSRLNLLAANRYPLGKLVIYGYGRARRY